MLRLLLCASLAALVAAPSQAAAPDPALLLQNPYSPPAAGRSEPASLEVVATTTVDGKATRQVVSLADTWISTATDEAVTVFDFARNRQFTVRGGSLESRNPAALPMLRVMEYQNRAYLSRVLAAAAAKEGKGPTIAISPCDVASELGVVLPIKSFTAEARIERTATGARLVCDGREYGRFEAGDRPAPASFWPYLADTFSLHPALLQALKQDGRIPRSVSVAYAPAGKTVERTWASGEIRAVRTEQPIRGDLRITGGADLPAPVRARLSALAEAAVAGKAAGGAPQSLAVWDARVRTAERERGKGAAFFEAMAGLPLFSSTGECPAAGSDTCVQIAALRERLKDEPAVAAYFGIIRAEQSGQIDDATDALASLKGSSLYDHPVIGAAYGLALHKAGPEALNRAGNGALPTDPLELHIKAIEAYPYNPNYWADLGDWFAGQYDYAAALYCWDVAASLPVPTMRPEVTGVVLGKREFVQRIRTDFPEFFAP